MTRRQDDGADRDGDPKTTAPDTDGDDGHIRTRLRRLPTVRTAAVAALVLVVASAAVVSAPAAGVSVANSASVTDSPATNAVTAQPSEPGGSADQRELSGSFSRPTYSAIAGDLVDIRYTASNSNGSAYLLIGGNRLTDTGNPVGYTDVVKLGGEFDGTINTRLLGTDEGTAASCRETDCDLEFVNENGKQVADSLSELSGATGAGGLARPLVPQRYRLAITNGTFVVEEPGVVTPVGAAASSDLLLTKPTFHDEIEVFTTADPENVERGGGGESLSALEQNGLDRTAVTKGDRVVLGFESTGIWGALSHFAAEQNEGSLQAGQELNHSVLSEFLRTEDGVSLEVRQTNPGMNEPRSELDLADADPEDVTLLLADAEELETGDSTPGRFYLVLDTSDGGPFTEDPEPGDEFTVEFALKGAEGHRYAFAEDSGEPPAPFEQRLPAPEQFPYWETADGTVSAEASFSVQERYFEYDHVTDDGELLVEDSGGAVTGTTTILPPIEMSATFVDDKRDEPFRSESQVELSEGNFSINADLGGADPGTRLNYELYDGTTLRDSRTVIVVDDTDDPDRLAIDGVPENATVAEGGNLSALGIDVRNAGGLEGEGTLALDVDDGNLTTARELTLSSNESRTVGFPSATIRLDPGEYPFTATLDGDRRNGTLIVAENPARTTIDENDSEGDGSDTDSSANSSNTDENTTDADGNTTDADENSSENDSTGSTTTDGNSSDLDENSSDPAGGSGGPDGGDEPATFLPFGIGTRETLLGTLLVGAVHLLGHWV
ncbi:BGTF surface domain-containing protein [Halorubrum trapanicum]|uniref:BGTF surface domain-containing protein n=1 Tax=Halorubrum trapanicum TaxID=29284 RepID=UPI003C6EF06C